MKRIHAYIKFKEIHQLQLLSLHQSCGARQENVPRINEIVLRNHFRNQAW